MHQEAVCRPRLLPAYRQWGAHLLSHVRLIRFQVGNGPMRPVKACLGSFVCIQIDEYGERTNHVRIVMYWQIMQAVCTGDGASTQPTAKRQRMAPWALQCAVDETLWRAVLVQKACLPFLACNCKGHSLIAVLTSLACSLE